MPLTPLQKRCRTIYAHQKKRAALVGQTLPYTVADLEALVLPQMGRSCPYCGRVLLADRFHCDHKIPTSRPGGTHDLPNLLPICATCNETKGTLTDAEFLRLLDCLDSFALCAKEDTLARLRAGGKARGQLFRQAKVRAQARR